MAASCAAHLPCDCNACVGLWPTLYTAALNFPVRARSTHDTKDKATAYRYFLECTVKLLRCPASKGALAHAMHIYNLDALGTREAMCRLVHAAETYWWNKKKGKADEHQSFKKQCAHYERFVRVHGGHPRTPTQPKHHKYKTTQWFVDRHCTDNGMRSAVWGPPLWLLLYALEESAHVHPREWAILWTRAIGGVLPCAVCRKRYAEETFPEVVKPYFAKRCAGNGAGGPDNDPPQTLVRRVHCSVRRKVSHCELAPRGWLIMNLKNAAYSLLRCPPSASLTLPPVR